MSAAEGPPTPEEIDRFMRATVFADWMHDQTVSMIEDRIMDLEEIVCASMARSLSVARRLRRRIRASISAFPGATFAHRRAEAVSNELAVQERRSGGRQGGDFMTWNRTALLAALPVAAVAVIAGLVSATAT